MVVPINERTDGIPPPLLVPMNFVESVGCLIVYSSTSISPVLSASKMSEKNNNPRKNNPRE